VENFGVVETTKENFAQETNQWKKIQLSRKLSAIENFGAVATTTENFDALENFE
jgi:hypothetical protein